MAWWRFSFAPIDDRSREFLASIPGFKVSGNPCTGLSASDNCAWLAGDLLRNLSIPFNVRGPRSFTPRNAKSALPYLREWVPAFMTGYQREGVKSVLALPGENGFFVWSAGAGKTLGALVWALAAGSRLAVVVTKAAIRPTWTREIETYTRGVEWQVLEGEKGIQVPAHFSISEKGPALYTKPLILVTGYDTLPAWIEYLERLKPTSVIFDESHKAKSRKRWNAEVETSGGGANVSPGPLVLAEEGEGEGEGEDIALPQIEIAPLPEPKVTFSLKDNQTAACYRLSRVARRRLATTATPIKDRVRDLWAQLDLIHPWEWGSYWVWAKRYCAASENIHGGMDDRGKSNLMELKKRLSMVSHRVPYSVANRDLPPKRRLVTYLKVYEQDRPIGGIAAELRAAARHGPTAILEARLMEAASRKRKIVLAHAHDALEAGQKVVIFTGRRVDCERLRKDAEAWTRARAMKAGFPDAPHAPDGTFTSSIPDLQLFSGHGGDSPEKREAIRRSYMAALGPALLIGTGDAWGEGLDLQDTDLSIFAMLPYTPGQIIQWEGRFARKGQKRPVLIRYFICEGSIDEHVATILLGKLPGVEKATDSDEIAGLGRELIGASEEDLLQSLCSKVLGKKDGEDDK